MPLNFSRHRCFLSRCLLLFFLLLPALGFADESDNSFASGKNAFERGDFATAYQIFYQLILQNPGDPETDFMLGRSAFESGDFEAAVFAYERVLIMDPEADRVRLELGRSYYELGDMESARSNLDRVLAKQPPETVKQNIHRYLLLINNTARRHNFSGSFSLGTSYDGNVYASPTDETIDILGGEITLNGDSATPQEDIIAQTSLQLNHLYRSHPKAVAWLTTGQAYNATYADEDELNISLFGFASGPVLQRNQQQSKLQFRFNYLMLDEQRYLAITGVSAEHSWQLSKQSTAALGGQISRLNYIADQRDGNQYRLEYKHVMNLPSGDLLFALGGEKFFARDNEYSYRRQLASLRYQHRLPWKLKLTFGLRFQRTDYSGEIGLFGKDREDRLRELSLGLSRPVWQHNDGQGRVLAQLNMVLNKTASNIDLYEYDKQVLSFSLSYLF